MGAMATAVYMILRRVLSTSMVATRPSTPQSMAWLVTCTATMSTVACGEQAKSKPCYCSELSWTCAFCSLFSLSVYQLLIILWTKMYVPLSITYLCEYMHEQICVYQDP